MCGECGTEVDWLARYCTNCGGILRAPLRYMYMYVCIAQENDLRIIFHSTYILDLELK